MLNIFQILCSLSLSLHIRNSTFANVISRAHNCLLSFQLLLRSPLSPPPHALCQFHVFEYNFFFNFNKFRGLFLRAPSHPPLEISFHAIFFNCTPSRQINTNTTNQKKKNPINIMKCNANQTKPNTKSKHTLSLPYFPFFFMFIENRIIFI